MDNQTFIENSFIIDLSNAKNTLEIINELSNILDMTESKEKNICLKIRDVELSQSQLLSIRALINATGSTLAFIDTNTERTIASANELGINISTINSNLEIEPKQVINETFESQENKQEEQAENQNVEDSNNNQYNEETNSEEQQDSLDSKPEERIEEQCNIELPSFIQQEETYKEETGNEFPSFESLYPKTEAIIHNDVPYEIFKTEEIKDEKSDSKELPTLYLRQTLRSGQTLSYDGNILVIGDTHPGSELIAKGDITVWGVLGGIAHAGTSGDKKARIRALKLNAIQLRIAGIYAGRLNTENIPYIQRSNEFTPQEARIENENLVIRNIYEEI